MTHVTGTIVSFYSYKGGVGRTMSVVNVAMTLAQNGFRVLVVDLDLLAPGVQNYPHFREAVAGSTHYAPPAVRKLGEGGMLDLIERQFWASQQSDSSPSPFRESFVPSTGKPAEWQKWVRRVHEDPISEGRVDVLPAGPANHRAIEQLAQIGWFQFLTQYGGLSFILSMRDQWWRGSYDFTLIDSRTGLSDYLQFCVGILPDVAVVVAGLNEQNLDGLSSALNGVKEVLPSRRADLFLVPVLSLVPSGEIDYVSDRFNRADVLLSALQGEGDLRDGRAGMRILGEPVRLPYIATFAVAERLVVPTAPHVSIFRSYVRIAEMLARYRFAEIDNLFDEAIYEGTKGLDSPDVIRTLDEARIGAASAGYMYGRIRSELLEGQRRAYGQDPSGGLEAFGKAISLIRERRKLRAGEPWRNANSFVGHWRIELDTLVFCARVLVDLGESAAAVEAFTDALEFLEMFKERNHSDIFSDRDWDRYSHELLFTKAFCHLGRLEAQISEVQKQHMVPTPTLQSNIQETERLFHQLMPNGINANMRERLNRSATAVTTLS